MKSEAAQLIELAESLNEAGANLSQISRVLDQRTCCLISAYREEYSKKENEVRRKELSSKLRSLGYGFINLKGAWTDSETGKTTEEKSCLVINIVTSVEKFIQVMLALMNEFEQDAIVIKVAGEEISSTYYRNGNITQSNVKLRTNQVADTGMFSLVQGRPFRIDESLENTLKEAYTTGFICKLGEDIERSYFLKKHKDFLSKFVRGNYEE